MISDVEKARIKLEFITKINSNVSELFRRGFYVTTDDLMSDLETVEAELESEVEELEGD